MAPVTVTAKDKLTALLCIARGRKWTGHSFLDIAIDTGSHRSTLSTIDRTDPQRS